MADPEAIAELNQRIAIVRDNLRELIEQAAAYSGAADEARNADRIADQEAKLAALWKEREALGEELRRLDALLAEFGGEEAPAEALQSFASDCPFLNNGAYQRFLSENAVRHPRD